MVVVPPETVAVARLRLYCAPTFLLQPGLLQLAVMYAVPGATAVRVAALPVVPGATVTLAIADEPQVRGGVMGCAWVSSTSAVSGWVPPVVIVKDVLEEFASCTIMDATGQVRY